MLDPWRVVTESPAAALHLRAQSLLPPRRPEGRQLPYVDRIVVDIAAAGLFAAKANAGEVDLLARGLSMNDVPVLKEGEAAHNYQHPALDATARGSAYALYPEPEHATIRSGAS